MSTVVMSRQQAARGRTSNWFWNGVLATAVCAALPVAAWGAKKATANQSAAAKVTPAKAAEELVREALYHEIYGAQTKRDQLLEAARSLAPDHAPAMWHSGYIRHKKRWVKVEDLAELASTDRDLAHYRARREETTDTAAGQLDLARWCEKRGLDSQARAHYSRVIQLSPNDRESRQKLGFRRLGGIWMTEENLREIESEAREVARALQQWTPTIQQIRGGLHADAAPIREAARQELMAIDDIRALPALERLLSGASEASAVALVNKLAEWNDPRASRSLARQAVRSSWEAVRQLASHQLRDRPKEDYVPIMIDSLSTPVVSRTAVASRGNQLIAREIYYREGQAGRELMVLDTAYRRVPQAGGDADNTLARAVSDMRQTVGGRQSAAMRQNLEQRELNRRIMDSLSIATGEREFNRVEEWWGWWNKYNEASGSEKPLQAEYAVRNVTLIDPVQSPPPSSGPPLVLTGGPGYNPECLVAGTEIWTLSGPAPVETLQLGDLVMAQDVESGEIGYKPVVATTVREAAPVFTIETTRRTIRASGGHLFWVSGEGWTKVRHLVSGQELHCATGTVRVSDVRESEPEPTYNIVVDGFSTYFVGDDRVLSHDVTLRQPTRAVVPGLVSN